MSETVVIRTPLIMLWLSPAEERELLRMCRRHMNAKHADKMSLDAQQVIRALDRMEHTMESWERS